MMQRRQFTALPLALALGAAAREALAQGAPVEGRQYRKLPSPMATNTPGKIEVIEFFWYGCPHCFVFEPSLKEWIAKQPADVAVRRVHVGFGGILRLHQRFFYALEALGLEATLHDRVFTAFHIERADVTSDTALIALGVKLGVEEAKMRQAWNSFGVQSKCLQATRLSDDYGIDGVPSLAVAGRYVTAPSMVAGPGVPERVSGATALGVTDYLIGLARK